MTGSWAMVKGVAIRARLEVASHQVARLMPVMRSVFGLIPEG